MAWEFTQRLDPEPWGESIDDEGAEDMAGRSGPADSQLLWSEEKMFTVVVLSIVIVFSLLSIVAGVDYSPLLMMILQFALALAVVAVLAACLWIMPNHAFRLAILTSVPSATTATPWSTTWTLCGTIFVAAGLIIQALDRLDPKSTTVPRQTQSDRIREGLIRLKQFWQAAAKIADR